MRPLFAVQKLDEEPRVSRMIGQPSLKPNRFGEADDKPKRVARRLRRAVLRLIRRPRRNIRVADTFGRWRFAGVSPAVARVGEFPLPHDVGGEVVKLRAKEYRPLAVVDNFVPVAGAALRGAAFMREALMQFLGDALGLRNPARLRLLHSPSPSGNKLRDLA